MPFIRYLEPSQELICVAIQNGLRANIVVRHSVSAAALVVHIDVNVSAMVVRSTCEVDHEAQNCTDCRRPICGIAAIVGPAGIRSLAHA